MPSGCDASFWYDFSRELSTAMNCFGARVPMSLGLVPSMRFVMDPGNW
jgi:hypothetical protein